MGRRYFRKISKKDRKRLIWGLVFLFLTFQVVTFPHVYTLKYTNPIRTSLMEIRTSEAESEGKRYDLRFRWVPLGSMAPSLRRAVISAEDGTFYQHHGFDFAEMWKVLRESIRHFSFPRGASTITQQLSKNLYLTESKNPFRKVKEALITLCMELFLKKDRILEIYLNVIEWGDGIFGVEAASQYYFKTTAANLSTDQACFLAAIIPGPRGVFSPKLNPGRVEARKELICRRLEARGEEL